MERLFGVTKAILGKLRKVIFDSGRSKARSLGFGSVSTIVPPGIKYCCFRTTLRFMLTDKSKFSH